MLTNLDKDLLEKTFKALTEIEKQISVLKANQDVFEKRIGTRLHKLESQAGFVKGFEKETQNITAYNMLTYTPKPKPKAGDIWLDNHNVSWAVAQVRGPYGWLTNENTNETKRLLLKSIKKDYRLHSAFER